MGTLAPRIRVGAPGPARRRAGRPREAKRLQEGKKTPETPGWVELIEGDSHYDSGRLARKAGQGSRLAAFLCMLTLRYPLSTGIGLQSSREVVAIEPDCFRAHDVVSEYYGVSTQHTSTMAAPAVLEQFLRRRLPGIQGIPPDLKAELAEGQTAFNVAEAFDRAGAPEKDKGEPAWGAVARMLRETRFVQVFRRLYFMKAALVRPVEDYWNEVREEIAGHRYAPFLETMTTAREAQAKFRQFAERLDLADVEMTETRHDPEPVEPGKAQRPRGVEPRTRARRRDSEHGVHALVAG